MAQIRIGKIRFSTDGVYNSATTYSLLATVSNADLTKVYASLVENNQGNPLTDDTKWKLILDVETAAQSATRKAIVTDADTSDTLYPNIMYEFGEVPSIDIGLSTPVSGEVNEWQFSFDSGSTATTFSVPAGVVWTSTVTIEASMHYEVNIVYDETSERYLGIIVGWANS